MPRPNKKIVLNHRHLEGTAADDQSPDAGGPTVDLLATVAVDDDDDLTANIHICSQQPTPQELNLVGATERVKFSSGGCRFRLGQN